MGKDIPVISLLKQPGETERLIRFALGTKGEVRILNEMDPVLKYFEEGKNGKILEKVRIRDLVRDAILVEGDECYAFIIGVEAQSDCDPSMPLRVQIYDDLLLMAQYEAVLNEKLGPLRFPPGREVFEKAFPDGVNLKPVYAIVLDLSLDEWFGPESIAELLDPDASEKIGVREIYRQRMRRIRLAGLSREEAESLGGELGIVSRIVRDTNEGTLAAENYAGVILGKNASRLYNEICGKAFSEVGNMSVEKKVNKFGLQKEAEGRYNSVKNLMKNGDMDADKAMKLIGIPESEYSACLKFIGVN